MEYEPPVELPEVGEVVLWDSYTNFDPNRMYSPRYQYGVVKEQLSASRVLVIWPYGGKALMEIADARYCTRTRMKIMDY